MSYRQRLIIALLQGGAIGAVAVITTDSLLQAAVVTGLLNWAITIESVKR